MGLIALGEKIRELRFRSALSQEDLAEASGLSLRSIQRIENVKTTPRGDSLKRIATALNVSIEELTEGQETNYADKDVLLKEDPKILSILILSALGYFLNPMLGIVFPTIVWLVFRNTTQGVNEYGLRIIKCESLWCSVVAFAYLYLLCIKFLHLSLPVPDNDKWFVLLILALYIANFCIILKVFFTWFLKIRALEKG